MALAKGHARTRLHHLRGERVQLGAIGGGFLGGWLAPFNVEPFTWIPGVIWFSLKLFFMFFLFAMAKAIVNE